MHWLQGDLSNLESLNGALNSINKQNKTLIIHAGAHVNHIHSYEALYKTNVESTFQLLNFCYQHEWRFVYISSTSAISPLSDNKQCSGYDLTKGACELLVQKAYENGLSSSIIKLPLIYDLNHLDRTTTEKDHFFARVKQCLYMRSAPNVDAKIIAMSAEDCAESVISIALSTEHIHRSYSLFHDTGEYWSDIIKYVDSELSFIPYQYWREKLLISENTYDLPLKNFKMLYQDNNIFSSTFFPQVKLTEKSQISFQDHIDKNKLSFMASKRVIQRVFNGAFKFALNPDKEVVYERNKK